MTSLERRFSASPASESASSNALANCCILWNFKNVKKGKIPPKKEKISIKCKKKFLKNGDIKCQPITSTGAKIQSRSSNIEINNFILFLRLIFNNFCWFENVLIFNGFYEQLFVRVSRTIRIFNYFFLIRILENVLKINSIFYMKYYIFNRFMKSFLILKTFFDSRTNSENVLDTLKIFSICVFI